MTSAKILIFYGSYRRDRMGIRLARWLTKQFGARGCDVELIDAQEVGLPMLDLRYSDYKPGEAPQAMTTLAQKIAGADAFVFVAGEYNAGIQPGLKNLVDHYLVEWARRPAAIASYSAGRMGGVRSHAMWHSILTSMGMAVTSIPINVAQIGQTMDASDQPAGDGGAALVRAFPRFADELLWWANAAKAQRG